MFVLGAEEWVRPHNGFGILEFDIDIDIDLIFFNMLAYILA